MRAIQMVDLRSQYDLIKTEVDQAIQEVIDTTAFINGPQVKSFSSSLAAYTGAKFAITCGNGTDALQIAMMGLDFQPGQEVIVPAFTYVATAEVIALLGLVPIFIDVIDSTYELDITELESKITSKTAGIVPVHLYGQCSNMEAILDVAKKHNIKVIEDTAQAIGAKYTFSDGRVMQAGTMGDIGTTSFFPSKNLGCYGDGGAMFTNDEKLAEKLHMIANHGQKKKYHHHIVGVNSRLDTLQGAILNVKLKHLDRYSASRNEVADQYDKAFAGHEHIKIPARAANSTHAFHQYTIQVEGISREELKSYLAENGVPSMVYYPLPLHQQEAYKNLGFLKGDFPVAESLCEKVLSLPIHTEMKADDQAYIIETINKFFS
ncbi:dTDP-4-amino-4,6-dideoxygalactose transaminase [Algoriphagus ratkowskyi]|uniref:DegT/DnrJ/EryC1/StrS family aminotransferase n=1 Tax=Algoriphagus ratkowskyi TaxID=57028 RepID=A0A2W7RHD2_9BACT|nr:DegT/DnrJ/EryC1/StrS family aminotransferase [Algoriphagus ratkowskyi]PZX57770.1 dTDP-4-amino-4,6-dideoxygalactose transaminase [Algoriphagus ratkowskyi]TXD79034.1 DegT/DnrJ/EryC1/StrS family aminotransferase [Algoriphagus ratkowskyi]